MSQGTSTSIYSLSNTILTVIKSQNQKVLTGDIDCSQLSTAEQPAYAWVRIGLSPAQRYDGKIVSSSAGTYFAMALDVSSEPFTGAVELPADSAWVYIEAEPEPFGETEDLIVIEA